MTASSPRRQEFERQLKDMKNIIAHPYAYLLLRLLLGGFFLAAGAFKFADTMAFAQAIDQYGLTSWRMSKLLSVALPAVEVATGLGLILDIRGALSAIVAQLLVFMAVLVYAISLGLDVDCGCFGPADGSASESGGLQEALVRDVFMLAACFAMYWQRRILGITPRSLLRPFRSNRKEHQ